MRLSNNQCDSFYTTQEISKTMDQIMADLVALMCVKINPVATNNVSSRINACKSHKGEHSPGLFPPLGSARPSRRSTARCSYGSSKMSYGGSSRPTRSPISVPGGSNEVVLGYSDERLASGDCRNFTNREENVDRRALKWMRTSVTATKMGAFSSERSLCLTRGKACLKSAMLLLVCSP